MTTKLHKFMTHLLTDPATSVASRKGKLPGFVLAHSVWNCRVQLYSDVENTYYLELQFLKGSANLSHSIPISSTYQSKDFNVIQPILEQFISRTEGYTNQRIPNARNYVKLFKDYLSSQTLPPEYQVFDGHYRLEIGKKQHNYLPFIEKNDLLKAQKEALSIHEPTGFISLKINNVDDQNNPALLFIPKVFFYKYPFLSPEKKLTKSTNIALTEEEWFNKVKNDSSKCESPLISLIEYLELNETLNSKENLVKKSKI